MLSDKIFLLQIVKKQLRQLYKAQFISVFQHWSKGKMGKLLQIVVISVYFLTGCSNVTYSSYIRQVKNNGPSGLFLKVLNSVFQISQFGNLIKRYVYQRDMIEISIPKLGFVTEPSPQILLVIQKGLFQFPNFWWNALDTKLALGTKPVRNGH